MNPKLDAPAGSERSSTWLIVAVTACWTISLMSYYAQAQLLGPIMERLGESEEAIGWMFSLENGALALSTLAAAGPLARISRTRVALAGGALVAIGNVAAAFAGSYELLTATRVLVGIGAGVAGAAGTAAAASAHEPQRVFAVVTVSWGLLGAGEPTLLAYAIEPFGAAGGYLLLAGLGLLLVPAFVWLLAPRGAEGQSPSLRTAPNRLLALIAMGGLLVFEIGQGGVYTFIAQIGEATGLDGYQVGNTMTGTGLAGLLGGVVAAWLGERLGRLIPIVVGISLNVAAAVGLALGDDAGVYIGLLFLWNAAYYFVIPYLMGAMAAMDDLGRWAVASDGAWTLGDALGPGIAGTLVASGGYPPLAALTLAAGMICVVVLSLVLRRLESKRGADSDAGP